MINIADLINSVTTLFIIMIISCIATKTNLITPQFIKGFSKFIICVA